jgi:hypothetical protein
MTSLRLFLGLALALASAPAAAGSLHFTESRPTHYEFGDLGRIPQGFGAGEFALELWIKPDNRFPVGDVWPPSYDQLKNWSDVDPKPYSSAMWWVPGNWLLDGYSRPRGFGPGDPRDGSIGLQLYGGGRVRFTFADKAEGMPKGGVYAVQAAVTKDAPSLLDGKWHHIVAQRRWRDPAGATLELWVDGRQIASTDIPDRTNMREFWNTPNHPKDPRELGGWAIGAEVMTAWKYAVTQFEDYKGLLDNFRFWNEALPAPRIAELAKGVSATDRPAAWFGFDERRGARSVDRFDPKLAITLHRFEPRNRSAEQGPRRP